MKSITQYLLILRWIENILRALLNLTWSTLFDMIRSLGTMMVMEDATRHVAPSDPVLDYENWGKNNKKILNNHKSRDKSFYIT